MIDTFSIGRHMVSNVRLELVRLPSGILNYRLSADVDGQRSPDYARLLHRKAESHAEAELLLPDTDISGADVVAALPHTVLKSRELTSFATSPHLVKELTWLVFFATSDWSVLDT